MSSVIACVATDSVDGGTDANGEIVSSSNQCLQSSISGNLADDLFLVFIQLYSVGPLLTAATNC